MPSLDWEKITITTYGLFSSVPMSTSYHDKELDLGTCACDKNPLHLQSPGDRSEKRDAEEALWLLKKSVDSVDKRKTGTSYANAALATPPGPGVTYS